MFEQVCDLSVDLERVLPEEVGIESLVHPINCITSDYVRKCHVLPRCSICPEMGTDIQVGPTGQKLLPLSVV